MENLIIYPPSFHYDIWTVNNTTVSHITTHSVGLWHRQKKLSLFPMDLVAPLWERNLLLSSYNGTSSPSLILLYSGCGWTVARHGTRIKDHPSNLVSCLLQTIYIIYVQSTFCILWAHFWSSWGGLTGTFNFVFNFFVSTPAKWDMNFAFNESWMQRNNIMERIIWKLLSMSF